MKMNSELDRIKSTITISLGTKNRLRKDKGSKSYEDYINYLMRLRNQKINKADNLIELQKFQRKKGLYSFENYKILFSYNQFNNSPNFIFDIKIELVRENGNRIEFKRFIKETSSNTNTDILTTEYKTYFELLKTAIRNEVEPLFRHNGRIEDHFSWKEEFKLLNLSDKSFEEDVMEKLNNYKSGLGAFE